MKIAAASDPGSACAMCIQLRCRTLASLMQADGSHMQAVASLLTANSESSLARLPARCWQDRYRLNQCQVESLQSEAGSSSTAVQISC